MTVEELSNKLRDLGILEDRYYLQGLFGSSNDDEKYAMIIKKGFNSIEYEIYFKERGEKHSIIVFDNESEACLFFYKRLKENKEIEDQYSRE
ncbi:hypothetical protein ACR78Z_05290 [Sphingobacterium thalpophilum]|uniref:Uncharacterized protein n=1 Tax=Sphingobacterium thalpophilum TaxID=259 RepID=A0A4U9W280_9SPHI|nr:hypothetical protein [Sphingobacterium thalpophilum]VTR52740.1 Uncharacterised protein [Sphingobacterium thalpophilum]